MRCREETKIKQDGSFYALIQESESLVRTDRSVSEIYGEELNL